MHVVAERLGLLPCFSLAQIASFHTASTTPILCVFAGFPDQPFAAPA
jgi:hypothetical protein